MGEIKTGTLILLPCGYMWLELSGIYFLFIYFRGAKTFIEAKVQLSYERGSPKLGCPFLEFL